MTAAGQGEEKATVREVYRLVGEVRTELGEKIDDVRDTLGEIKDSLLPRVSVLEEKVGQHTTEIATLDGRVSVLESAHARVLGGIGVYKVLGGIFGGAGTLLLGEWLVHVIVG